MRDYEKFNDLCNGLISFGNEDISICYPWISINNDDKSFDFITQSVLSAFDVSTTMKLARQGITVLDTINQLLLFADLSYLNSIDSLRSIIKTVRQTISSAGRRDNSLFITLIVNLRSVNKYNPNEDNPQKREVHETNNNILTPNDEILRDLESAILKEKLFNRVFFIDITNQEGVFLTNPTEQYFLMSQLWYYFISKPTSDSEPDDFIEWYNSVDSSEGLVSSFGACMARLPIAEIIELLTLKKGAELLEYSLIKESNENRYEFYFHNFIKDNSLIDLEHIRSEIRNDHIYPLYDPLMYLPNYDDVSISSYLKSLNEFKDSFTEALNYNGQRTGHLRDVYHDKLLNSTTQYVDTILSHERGGIIEAIKFIEKTNNHLEGIIDDAKKTKQVFDNCDNETIEIAINTINDVRINKPSSEAIIIRSFLLMIGLWCLLFIIDFSTIVFLFGLFIVPIICLLIGGLYYSSVKKEIEDTCNNAHKMITETWESSMKSLEIDTVEFVVNSLKEHLINLKEELEHCKKRIDDTVSYYSDEYVPAISREQALAIDLVSSREDMLLWGKGIEVDFDATYINFRSKTELYVARERLTGSRVSAPTNYEASLVERAALQILPYFGSIANISVSKWLQKQQALITNSTNAMLIGANPFISPDPNIIPMDWSVRGVFESEKDNSTEQMISEFQKHLDSIVMITPESRSRVTLFEFIDGVKFNNFDGWIG